jgi:hypothetical protein
VADDNWQEVMSLVSLTTWTAQDPSEYASCNHVYNGAPNVCAYPTLIYHKEATDIYDADSILYFIDQYNANNITAVNNPPTELVGQINGKGITPDIIFINDYLSYWENYNDVVYVEDNYQLALIASTFASLKNAPLVVRGSSLDTAGTFSNKNVYAVGAVTCPTSALSCTSFSDVVALEQEYLSQTNTDKLVLVNYNDLNIALNTFFYPQYASNPIHSLYSSQSISSPFLASAKHELLMSTYKNTYSDIDAFLDSKISVLAVQPKYLTIVASPESIPMSKDNSDTSLTNWQEVDYLYYANIDQDLYPELATGRIFSLSSSDVSAYIARSLYYNKIPHSNNFSMLWPNYFGIMKLEGKSIDQIFSQAGFNQQSIYYDEGYSSMDMHRDLENKFYINYLDHGFQDGYIDAVRSNKFSIQDIWLKPTFVVSEACLTCAYDQSSSYYKKYLYCAHTIRRGAIMNVGAVESTYNDTTLPSWLIANGILRGEKIGDVMLEFKKAVVIQRLFMNQHMGKTDNWYVLLGDPLFSISNNYPTNVDKIEITKDPISNFVLLSIPEINQRGTLTLVNNSNKGNFYLFPAGKGLLYHRIAWNVSGGSNCIGMETYYINIGDRFNINDIDDIILIDSNGHENSLNFSDSLYSGIADIAKTTNFTLGSNWNYTLDILIQKNYNFSNFEYNIIISGLLLNNGANDCSIYNIQPMPAHGFKIIFR